MILWRWKNLHPLIVLSLCCSNSSLPLSFGRFDSEMYPLLLINENFHLAKKKKEEILSRTLRTISSCTCSLQFNFAKLRQVSIIVVKFKQFGQKALYSSIYEYMLTLFKWLKINLIDLDHSPRDKRLGFRSFVFVQINSQW